MRTQPTPETSNGRVVIVAPDDARKGQMGEARLSKPGATSDLNVWAVTLDAGGTIYRFQSHLRWLLPGEEEVVGHLRGEERLDPPDLYEGPRVSLAEAEAKGLAPYQTAPATFIKDEDTEIPEPVREAFAATPSKSVVVARPKARLSESEDGPSERKLAKVYISGPMTGIPDHNRDAFYEAERALEAMGYDTINPARVDEEEGMKEVWHDFLARDMALILGDENVVGIVFIEGWRNSRGATLEGYVAQQGGKKLWELVPVERTPEQVADFGPPYELRPVENVSVAYAAQSVVLGARRYAYGHPLDNFLKIAELWNATIGHKLTEPLDVRDVAMLMIQVKLAREYNAPKEDNQVDVCGYALAYQEALNEIVRRGGSLEGFLSTNAALLRQHSVLGTDSNSRPE